ncbi:WXG100 family type VII secretion target [Fodinicola acaciae]|uniref:WXG100 family type VII secretion target n=1 Tax=Fodinicola acaciae TaxID=2681555 RepID=UPI0013D52B02|nr:hypothetical protein [Fodinicola acaciae]
MRSSARGISDTGGTLSRDVQTLAAQVTGDGSPWGGDEAGSLIGAAYTEVMDIALQTYASFAETLDMHGAKVTYAANNHEATETGNELGFGGFSV